MFIHAIVRRFNQLLGICAPTQGGTGLSSYTLGDLPYASAANTLARLPGNTSAAKRYLSQTGTGIVSAAPAWDTVAADFAGLTGAATPAQLPATVVYSTPRAANEAFLGPAGGAAASPTFRLLVAQDIPPLAAAKIGDFDTQVRASRLDQMAAPTASVNLNSQKISNLLGPTADLDAANKAYVDAARSGLDVKPSVRVATTAAGTLASSFENGDVVDGITLATGDRILIKDQASGAENGIYTVNASGAPTRATDADSPAEVTPGMFTFVEQGTVNADSGWVLTTDGAITPGTTALAFVQFSGAGQVVAGSGLTKAGNTLAVGAGTGIVVGVDDVALAGQALALHNLATNGIIARTASGAVAARTLTQPAAGIVVSDGDGVSGNPTLALANDLAALEGLGSTGLAVRTATDTWAQRTLTGTANQVVIANGNGVAANPTFSLPQSIHAGASPSFVDLNLHQSNDSGFSGLAIYRTDATTHVNMAMGGDNNVYMINSSSGGFKMLNASGTLLSVDATGILSLNGFDLNAWNKYLTIQGSSGWGFGGFNSASVFFTEVVHSSAGVNASSGFRVRDAVSGAISIKATSAGIALGGGATFQSILSAVATLDFPSIAANGQAELAISVAGAATGDTVHLGRPAGLESGLVATARVTAADTVTVRVSNLTAGAIDPASASYRATVIKY